MTKCDYCGLEMPDDAGWIVVATCVENEEVQKWRMCHECIGFLEEAFG